jgi:competence protein ComEA
MKRYRLLAILAVVALMFSAPMAMAQAKKPAPKTAKAPAPLDINSATKAELTTLAGIGDAYSQKIIDGRPYARKDELVSKNILPQATYDKIKSLVIATQAKKK